MKNSACINQLLPHLENFVDNLGGEIALGELQGLTLAAPEAALATILEIHKRLKTQQNLARVIQQACHLRQQHEAAVI